MTQAIQTLSHFGYTQLLQPFTWPIWMPLPSVRRARDAVHTLNKLVTQHIHSPQSNTCGEGDDLLTMLRLTRDPESPNQGLSAQELQDQTMVMFLAGHETSATALSWW